MTARLGKIGPSTQTRRRSLEPSAWRIGATQLKQAPKPQAMWFSSERSHSIPCRSTILDRTSSMAGGPHPTTLSGRSPRSRRRARRSVTYPRYPQHVAGPEPGQARGSSADDQIDHVDRRGRAVRPPGHVVERERPAEEWVGPRLAAYHHELARQDRPGHRGVVQPEQERIPR